MIRFRPAGGAIALLIMTFLIPCLFTALPASAPAAETNSGSVTPPTIQTRGQVNRPRIIQRRIRFGVKRKHQMAAYSKRHYGKRDWRLTNPRVIVEHYSVAPTIGALLSTFRSDLPDPEFNELPNVCAHFGVARTGKIFQFVSLDNRCRHTVGLNQTAIGIEHVGYSDNEILTNPAQMRASLKLTRWLRCRFDIRISDVIGHNESLRSPFHHEKLKKMKQVTHGDFRHSSMRHYRKRLRRTGGCPAPASTRIHGVRGST